MKIPKKFKIFGQTVKVRVGDLGPNYAGMYYPSKSMIVIDKSVTKEEMSRVIIHEFIHSVIHRCSLDQVISYPSEEILVDMITKAIVENFKIDTF